MGKMENKKDQLVGEAKEKVGGATGDRDLEAEGAAQETKGDIKDVGEKVKDVFR